MLDKLAQHDGREVPWSGNQEVIEALPAQHADEPFGDRVRPLASCFAERLVLTVRTELTDRMLIFGERHLRSVRAHYSAHYNRQRPHRALQLHPPRQKSPVPEPVHGRIRRRPILGGLINQYEAAA